MVYRVNFICANLDAACVIHADAGVVPEDGEELGLEHRLRGT
jgi:hypothetical protein